MGYLRGNQQLDPPLLWATILQRIHTHVYLVACSNVHVYLVGLDAYFLSELPSNAFLCVRSDTTMGPTCVRAANALLCIYTGSSVDFLHISWHVFKIVLLNSCLK